MRKIMVTGSDHRGRLSWQCIRYLSYFQGNRAIRSTPLQQNLNSPFDVLILSGGADIHPSRYGEESLVRSRYEEDRDQLEWEWIERAIREEKPILGICRGMQMLNVYFGGTLYQEVGRVFDDFLPPSSLVGKVLARHTILVDENSQIFRIMKSNQLRVNSLHHQAVNTLGDGLKVTARLKNGMVQAIEHKKYPFIMGVQWHPELMFYSSVQRGLFNA